ncbi:SPFH domain-containing protein [Oscillibacter sp. MSJ-2]|uniref:SPFH domain-containing protein n=1 Tax=Dysosmobacter acutus TaxID=2841504 RepID=A0ABS6F830_9FIRM|nr:SPFH domain-containing protein [Dysosmobacter acutus]MBU5626195.1 SPFH domain-containing protein [Dysosmobacter acutus]
MAIAEVIKYEGDNSIFVWKYPKEDFNTNSQLIVHESQEAVFFLNGQPLDLFGSGRYTLETENIPLLRHAINIPTGGQSAFHCEVYFINKIEQMAIRWGTDSKVQYVEPTYGFPLSIGASGEMSLRAENSIKLLTKLVGTEHDMCRDKLVSYFRAFLMTKVKTYIAQSIRELKANIFEIDEQLLDFSSALKEKLTPDFADYGIALERFFVSNIVKPDGEPQYEKFKELHFRQYADIAEARIRQQVGVIDQEAERQKVIIKAQGTAQKRSIEGYTYQQERGFDIAEKAAQNEGAGNFSSAGIGLGMMTGVGGAVSGMVGGAVGGVLGTMNAPAAMHLFCENCGAQLMPGAAFCENCGAGVAAVPHCVKCGYLFERPGKFCPKCGAKREEIQ